MQRIEIEVSSRINLLSQNEPLELINLTGQKADSKITNILMLNTKNILMMSLSSGGILLYDIKTK